MTTSYLKICIALLLLVAAGGIVSAATVRQGISYQGILMDASNNPLTGTYSVKFTLYDASTGGTILSTDTRSVTAANGLFTTAFAVENAALVDGRAIWLGIKVGADPEMTPRQEIWPVPYALSLRPGSFITSTGTSPALLLENNGGGPVLNLTATKDKSTGVNSRTQGLVSDAFSALTMGDASYGLDATTSGDGSYGIRIKTLGTDSHGVDVTTDGDYSPGIFSRTSGYDSNGIIVSTEGEWSQGVYVDTNGPNSTGLQVHVWGSKGAGLLTHAYGAGSIGVDATSDQSVAVVADTYSTDHKWGFYTQDYLYAGGTQVPSPDVAEYMPVNGDTPPGTILVIGKGGVLSPSKAAYDTRVAGIVSTEPGVILGAKEAGNPGEALVAVAGRVPCRVDASYGAITEGDLLATSDTPGYAMKAANPKIGTVLGKAMGSLESGTGTIEVLVTLQ